MVKGNKKNGDWVDGTYEMYHENGNIQVKGTFINGKYHGLWNFFNEDGSLEKSETYKDGELVE